MGAAAYHTKNAAGSVTTSDLVPPYRTATPNRTSTNIQVIDFFEFALIIPTSR